MLRITVVGCLLGALATAQQPQPSPQLTCNERYVYVLRGDQLLQFDADTLVLVRQTMLLDPATTRRAAGLVTAEIELQEIEPPEESEEPILQELDLGGGSRGRCRSRA